MKGICQALSILSKEKPDVVFSKGGFVAVPVVMAASIKKIPVIAHESDLTPGLANKLAAPFCNKLCVTFRESLKYIKEDKGALTGTPIRREILEGNRAKEKEICNFKQEKDMREENHFHIDKNDNMNEDTGIYYIKNKVINGLIGSSLAIYMRDINGRYWHQPLFAPNNETDNSILCSFDDFKDATDIDIALKCFRGELPW